MGNKWISALMLVFGLLLAETAGAIFHTFQINQIYSNADGSVQYVMLKEGSGLDGQNFIGGHTLTAGTKTFTFPGNLPSGATANRFVLIATQGFANLNVVTPDYIIPAGFIPTGGGTINFASVDSVTLGPLPIDGTNALNRRGLPVPNSPTNFAGQSGTIGSTAITPQSGWWWNANENGRGFFIELRGSTLFMAGYLYGATGNPYWFIAAGPYSGNRFSAAMDNYAQGQTLTGAYKSPVQTPSPGNVSITFTSATEATLTWPGGTVPLARYLFGSGGQGFPQNGWWWNPGENGRGFSLETQGNTLFVAGYMYDNAGNPIWYISAGPMTATTTGGGYGGEMSIVWSYTGNWQQYANGQAMGGPYQPPTLVGNAGSLGIIFNEQDSAVLTLPDGRQLALIRFVF